MLPALPKDVANEDVATGSASELEYQFHASDDLNLIDFETGHRLKRRVVEAREMLASLARKVEG